MNITPLLEAGPVIQAHAAAAILAIAIGPIAIFRRRRDRVHKTLGYIWVTAMLVTALSALFIFEIRLWGPFSPIHLLAFLVFWSLWRAITKIRMGDVAGHQWYMKSLYVQALGIAGLFTLLPGRIMSDVLFPHIPWVGFSLCAGLLSVTLILVYVWRAPRSRSKVV